jgi:hypothetical protein
MEKVFRNVVLFLFVRKSDERKILEVGGAIFRGEVIKCAQSEKDFYSACGIALFNQ